LSELNAAVAHAIGRDAVTTYRNLMSAGAALAMGIALVASPQPAFAQEALEAPESAKMIPNSFADLAERLSPAVVNITTTTNVVQAQRGPAPVLPEGSPFEEFFRDFMERQPGPGGPNGGPRRSNALGSGFIISPDGYIVTNNHVIDGADEISIELFEGGNLDAKVVGRDARTDIALLKVESDEPLPFVEFGDSDGERVGDWVVAIGNPLGQGFSVSSGIVSARNRTLQGSYDDFIQTDAAINRGNSGGPLFNMDGEVIGVNTAILSPNGGSIGIGFAMSSAVVERVVAQLREFGETRRGWLGVRIQNVDADMAEALGLETPDGALVTDVPEGPAADAGLKAGDVITSFDGKPIKDTRELVRIVADTAAGRDVELEVVRDRKVEKLPVEIGLLEEPTLAAAVGPDGENFPATPAQETVLGVSVAAITDGLREKYGISDEASGLIVTSVDQSSEAFTKGIQEGDLITEAGQEPVDAPRDLRDRIKAAEDAGRNSILLLVRRDGAPRFVALNLSN
jgi:serine protease Do